MRYSKLPNAHKGIRRIRIPAFRIFYNTTYSLILLILFAALAITPGDHIYQTVSNSKLGNVFVVAGTYLVTAIIALFIYLSRLYTNRTALAAIPRSYLPIAKGEVSKTVFRTVVKERERSALVAWESRPRDLGPEISQAQLQPFEQTRADSSGASGESATATDEKHSHHLFHHKHHRPQPRHTLPMQTLRPISPSSAPWGSIAHPGWSAPGSLDMPSLHFQPVLAELPYLLEAQAVALAPPDPAFAFLANSSQDRAVAGDTPPAAQIPRDPSMVAAVQRRPDWGLREYVGHLMEVGIMHVDPGEATAVEVEAFLRRYEYARYSVEALTEDEFRDLMARFARVLSMMGAVEHDGGSRRSGDSVAHGIRTAGSSLRSGRMAASDGQSIASSSGSVIHYTIGGGENSHPRTAETTTRASSSSLGDAGANDVGTDDDTGSVLHHQLGEEHD